MQSYELSSNSGLDPPPEYGDPFDTDLSVATASHSSPSHHRYKTYIFTLYCTSPSEKAVYRYSYSEDLVSDRQMRFMNTKSRASGSLLEIVAVRMEWVKERKRYRRQGVLFLLKAYIHTKHMITLLYSGTVALHADGAAEYT